MAYVDQLTGKKKNTGKSITTEEVVTETPVTTETPTTQTTAKTNNSTIANMYSNFANSVANGVNNMVANAKQYVANNTLEGLTKAWEMNKNNYSNDAKGNSEYWSEYQKALNDLGSKNATNKEFDTTTYNIYKNYVDQNATAAKNQYDAYILNQQNALDSKIEQSTMKDNAMKYAASQMANSGLGSQGVAQSYQAAIGNNYNSNMANIDNTKANNDTTVANTYNQAVIDSQNNLTKGLMENTTTNKANAYEMAVTMLENANSQEDVQSIKDMYYNTLSAEQQKSFDFYAKNVEDNNFSGTTFASIDDLREATAETGKRDKKVSEKFDYETEELNRSIQNGKVGYGETVLLENGSGQYMLVKWTKNGYQIVDFISSGTTPPQANHYIKYSNNNAEFKY